MEKFRKRTDSYRYEWSFLDLWQFS